MVRRPTLAVCHPCGTFVTRKVPLQDISLDQVPGVGDKTSPKLRAASISSAEALFGYFLYGVGVGLGWVYCFMGNPAAPPLRRTRPLAPLTRGLCPPTQAP